MTVFSKSRTSYLLAAFFMYKPALLESLFFYLSARKGLNALCSQVIATEPKR